MRSCARYVCCNMTSLQYSDTFTAPQSGALVRRGKDSRRGISAEESERHTSIHWGSHGDGLATDWYYDNSPVNVMHITNLTAESVAMDLESFSRHAGRSTITTDDVLLLARRNSDLHGIIKEFVDKKKATQAKGKSK